MNFRAGDAVKHGPSNEEWVLARVDGDYVYPAGWPPCRAETKDCELVEAATDEEHADMVAQARKLPRSDARSNQ